MGTPTEEEIQQIHNEKYRKHVGNLPVKPRVEFDHLARKANPLAIDLLKKMLVFDPQGRISVSEALQHPYLSHLHDPDDEPICSLSFDFDIENEKLVIDDYREMIFNEVTQFHAAKQHAS